MAKTKQVVSQETRKQQLEAILANVDKNDESYTNGGVLWQKQSR